MRFLADKWLIAAAKWRFCHHRRGRAVGERGEIATSRESMGTVGLQPDWEIEVPSLLTQSANSSQRPPLCVIGDPESREREPEDNREIIPPRIQFKKEPPGDCQPRYLTPPFFAFYYVLRASLPKGRDENWEAVVDAMGRR